MADFQLKVTAETQDAEQKLQSIDKVATAATRDRPIKIEIPSYSQLSKNLGDLKKDIGEAANTVKQFYRVTSQLPVGPVKEINEMASQLKNVATAANDTRKNVGDAGDVIRTTLDSAGKAAESLVGKLTRIAFSLYVINQAVRAVNEAFGGMFKETIGREIKLRETILKTQTTLASTNKVFRDGKEITDPYQKIVALTGEVAKRIDSIRERSIALAGVTSNDVIEIFGIVASQVGQIGGGLKEAEDLAINFAAALGTFGIPLYQARQEIGSILRGDITTDSYLAKALGITNQDVAKAKTQVGGVVKFLEERLAASVAGQKIAAEGFAGVVSNIKDIQELVSQSFGRGLLDPLLDGLTKIFDLMFRIRKELLSVSELAGKTIGTVTSGTIGKVLGASGVSKNNQENASKVLNTTADLIRRVAGEVTQAFNTIYLQLAKLLERSQEAFVLIGKGLAALAKGLLSLKLEQLKAAVGTIEALSPALVGASSAVSGFLGLWGKFMELPVVQEISQIALGMRALEATGVSPLIRSGFILQGVIANWSKVTGFVVTQFNTLRAIIGGVIVWIGGLGVAASQAGAKLLAAWTPQSKALQALRQELTGVAVQLGVVGNAAQVAGTKVGSLQSNGVKLGGGIVTLVANFIKFNALMFVISAAISTIIERFSAWKESQDKIASDRRAEEALRRLQTTYKDVGNEASQATKRAKEFEESLVAARYDEAFENLKKIEDELKGINELLAAKGRTSVFDDIKRGTAELLENLGKTWELLKLIASARPLQFDKPKENRIFGFDIRNLTDEGRRDILLERELAARREVDRWARASEISRVTETVKLEADKRVNLEKEIQDLRRQHENELFQQRQNLAQKEVEIFRAAGELRIFQMEQANRKLLEGEEGASAAALEALNNYLSVRERGELEIESAKQNLAIEVANMERSIMNYRLEMEKKIFDLRKRAGENDIASARAREQLANQQLGGPVPADEAGRQEKAFQFFVSKGLPTLSAAAMAGGFSQESNLRSNAINPSSGAEGIAQWLGSRKDAMIASGARNNFNKQLEFAWQELQGSESAALERLRNARTLNQALLAAASYERFDGYQSIGAGTEWGDRIGYTNAILNRGNRRGQASSPPSTAATPQLQGRSDIGDGTQEANEFAAAIQNVTSAMERLRLLQAALVDARTATEFENIAKALFPKVALEEYDNQIAELQLSLDSLAKVSADVYDPEKLKIAVEQKAKELIGEREKNQLLEKAKTQLDKKKISQEEYNKLLAEANAKQREYNNQLKEEEKRREKILQQRRKEQVISDLITATGGIPAKLRQARANAIGAMATAYAGDGDFRTNRMIEAELEILQEKLRLEKEGLANDAQAQEALRKFAEQTRKAAGQLAELDKAVAEFRAVMATIRDVAKGITDSQKTMVKSVLMGGDLKEAVKEMSRSITDKVMTIALDYAFKPMEDMLVKTMKDAFGIKDPKEELQKLNNLALEANTKAIEANTAAQGRGAPSASAAMGGTAILPGEMNIDDLMMIPFGSIDTVLEEGFRGFSTELTKFGEPIKNITNTVTESAQKAGEAADEGTKGFQKFLGGMMGVATGVISIAGGIQQIQEGGTSNVLGGIGSIFLGLGSALGGFMGMGLFAEGGVMSPRGAVPLRRYARGGVANTPQLAMFGEGSKPEAYVPLPDGRTIPVTLSGREKMNTMMGRSPVQQAAPTLNMTFQTTNIGGVEYVSRDQLEAAMAETRRAASRDGARRGMSMTLDKLQQSPSTRRQLGMF